MYIILMNLGTVVVVIVW